MGTAAYLESESGLALVAPYCALLEASSLIVAEACTAGMRSLAVAEVDDREGSLRCPRRVRFSMLAKSRQGPIQSRGADCR